MRLLSTILLLAIAVVSMVAQGANAKEVCEDFPVPNFENETEVKGVYQNWDYGYEVRLPGNLFGYRSPAPAPNHGFGILISSSPITYVWIDASYLTEEKASLKQIVDTHLGWVCEHGTNCVLEGRTGTRFAGVKAEEFIVHYTCRKSGILMKEEQSLALRKDIVYTVGLIAAPETYQKAKAVADRLRDSWTPLLWLKFDKESEKRLQKAVNKNGHQPWRLEAASVAHVTVLAFDKSVPYDSCHPSYETDFDAVVQCGEKQEYTVRLRKLFGWEGIWTATGIEIGK